MKQLCEGQWNGEKVKIVCRGTLAVHLENNNVGFRQTSRSRSKKDRHCTMYLYAGMGVTLGKCLEDVEKGDQQQFVFCCRDNPNSVKEFRASETFNKQTFKPLQNQTKPLKPIKTLKTFTSFG